MNVQSGSRKKGIPSQSTQALENLREKARQLGATTGAQRIELLLQQSHDLDLQGSYALLDLDSIQQEIEEARNHRKRVRAVHILRTIASLLPLLWTWVGLWMAVNSYQNFLRTHQKPADLQSPFLTLWIDGFRHTALDFGTTAMVTIILLACYLGTLLFSQMIDGRIQRTAATFVDELTKETALFIASVLHNRATSIPNPDDVKSIAQAVKQVIDSAMMETRQIIQGATEAISRVETHAQQAINASNAQIETLLKTQVTPLLQAFDTHTQKFNTRLSTLEDQINKLGNSTNQLQTVATSLLNNVERDYILGTMIDDHLQTLHQSEQALAEQLGTMTAQVTSSLDMMNEASTSVGQAARSIEAASLQLKQGLATALTRLEASDKNEAIFQHNLHTFNEQLDKFQQTLETLTASANELGGNMHTYTDLGEQIHLQVQELARSEAGILTQFTNTNGTMTSMSGKLDQAAHAMEQTKDSLVTITDGINKNTQTILDTMINNIGRATVSLSDVEKQLNGTSNVLLQVTNHLAALPQNTPQLAPLQQTVDQLDRLQKTLDGLIAVLQGQNPLHNGTQSVWTLLFKSGANRSRTGEKP